MSRLSPGAPFVQVLSTSVLVMLAPCGKCHAPKGELLEAVLNQEQPLITDLVVDTLTVSQMLGQLPPTS